MNGARSLHAAIIVATTVPPGAPGGMLGLGIKAQCEARRGRSGRRKCDIT